MQPRILRIIDANANRVSEGLRVLEDIARFAVEDVDVSQKLKSARHKINGFFPNLGPSLISSRDSESDIGSNSDLTPQHQDLITVAKVNAKRAQEGIRVLEELSKLPEFNEVLNTNDLRKARYQVYSLEKELLFKLSQKSVLDKSGGKVEKKTKKI